MTTYYQLVECTVRDQEAGEVVARIEATDRRQALRRLRISERNAHLYEVVPASRLPENIYDPRGLVRR